MVRFGFKKKKEKEEQAKVREEPVFPDYPQDPRELAGKRTVSEALRKPSPARPPARPPAPTAPLGPSYEEEPEEEEKPEESEESQEEYLNSLADEIISNNLVEEFYTILQEKLELKTLYEKIVKARKLYGKRGV